MYFFKLSSNTSLFIYIKVNKDHKCPLLYIIVTIISSSLSFLAIFLNFKWRNLSFFNILVGVLTGKFELNGNGRRPVFQSHRRCLVTLLHGNPIKSGSFHWVIFTWRTSGAVVLVSIKSPWSSVARHPLYLKAIFNS